MYIISLFNIINRKLLYHLGLSNILNLRVSNKRVGTSNNMAFLLDYFLFVKISNVKITATLNMSEFEANNLSENGILLKKSCDC